MTITTQRDLVQRHLESGRSITPLEALRLYGCFRLSACIWVLKHKRGMNIETTMVEEDGKRFAEYSLVD
ncbi:MAG: helix-turn-helix domain-containing protein [Porphyromonas sp.]|uniref:helix-turn-helix domain-containing protein n=1 Tax=Porphyromonas sp. TaxID=1924944 RepID=UPI002A765FF3|nr:helix-turn-helix domain-containing protein [Porphyromonas sp.]MDY3111038.1 helix-turn-helix domain-containing protein [Porphyromonas sp.]MDY4246261.1 helix-turn-helix domain-containing protein [Porphyromonas sp.]